MSLDIDALLLETADRHNLPSIVLGVSRYGALISTHAVGARVLGQPTLPDADSVYRIASMTKSFTAAAILLLRDRGALRLDDALRSHLPWFDDDAVTIRDVLTMNAGFPTDDPWGDRHEPTALDAFDALVAEGVRRIRPARTGFEYSNLGYALLGRVIATVTGRAYTEFIEQELLAPLGMHSSRFHFEAVPAEHAALGYSSATAGSGLEPQVTPGAFSPMGGLHSSVRDLTTWVAGFLDAHAQQTMQHPLAATSRREQQQPMNYARQVVRTEPKVSASAYSYGYGLLAEDHSKLGRFVFHNGGYPGFGSQMRWHPTSGLAVVGLTNRTYGAVYPVAERVLNELVAAEPSADATIDLWPETRAAMQVAERLLAEWDDGLADAHFALNMDLDQPREPRKAAVGATAETLGAFERVNASATSRSAAHVRWQVRGTGGSAWLELLLSPDPTPRIQLFKVDLEGN